MGMSQKVNGVMHDAKSALYSLLHEGEYIANFHIDISVPLTLFRMGLFGAPYGWSRPKSWRAPPPHLKSVTQIPR